MIMIPPMIDNSNFAEKKVFYDHQADKREKKWGAEIDLVKENDANLPDYIIQNKEKFNNWLD